MAVFRYQALNADQQLVSGELSADTVTEAVAQLESAGLTVQSIGYASESRTSPAATAPSTAVKESPTSRDNSSIMGVEQRVLRSHIGSVLEQGTAITPALRAYAEEMPAGRRRRQLKTVCDVIDRADVAGAEATLGSLPEYWIPLLSAAASSRDPGRVLREFLEESHEADQLRRQWWLTLAYPFFVAAIAAIVLIALSFIVIPIFRNIYEEFDLMLPRLTLLILTVAQWITSGWALITLVLLLVVVGAFLWNAKRLPLPEMPSRLSRILRLPFGRSTSIARLARFTADLLEAGLPVTDALRIAGFSTKVTSLRRTTWRLANELEADPTTAAHSQYPLSAVVAYAVRAEMPTASRIRLLREISDCHAERARVRLSWTRGIIEPITICVIGLLVAITVVALYMPLIKLVEGLSS